MVTRRTFIQQTTGAVASTGLTIDTKAKTVETAANSPALPLTVEELTTVKDGAATLNNILWNGFHRQTWRYQDKFQLPTKQAFFKALQTEGFDVAAQLAPLARHMDKEMAEGKTPLALWRAEAIKGCKETVNTALAFEWGNPADSARLRDIITPHLKSQSLETWLGLAHFCSDYPPHNVPYEKIKLYKSQVTALLNATYEKCDDLLTKAGYRKDRYDSGLHGMVTLFRSSNIYKHGSTYSSTPWADTLQDSTLESLATQLLRVISNALSSLPAERISGDLLNQIAGLYKQEQCAALAPTHFGMDGVMGAQIVRFLNIPDSPMGKLLGILGVKKSAATARTLPLTELPKNWDKPQNESLAAELTVGQRLRDMSASAKQTMGKVAGSQLTKAAAKFVAEKTKPGEPPASTPPIPTTQSPQQPLALPGESEWAQHSSVAMPTRAVVGGAWLDRVVTEGVEAHTAENGLPPRQ